MKSAINTLQIENNKLAIKHSASLTNLEEKNNNLTEENMAMRKELMKFQLTVRQL
jgi:hypothetical protein